MGLTARRGGIVAGLGIAVLLSMGAQSCGTTTTSSTPVNTAATSGSTAASASGSTSTTASSTTTTKPAKVAHVGSTVAVSFEGQKGNVTLLKVIDPAKSANQFLGAGKGKRLVGVELQIANTGSKPLTGDVNNSAVVIGSDNQTYNATFSDITGCTNFNSGSFNVTPGAKSTGCASFALPNSVKPVKVQFDLSMGLDLGGTAAQWDVP